jgi:hypothetical protein
MLPRTQRRLTRPNSGSNSGRVWNNRDCPSNASNKRWRPGFLSHPRLPQSRQAPGPPVPPPDQPELDPVQLQKELRESLEQTNLPPQFIENEVRGSVPEASPPPPAWQPPGASLTSPPDQPELEPAQLREELRESLKQTNLPPQFIEAEVELRTGGSSQTSQESPEPPPGFPEKFP